MFAPESFRSLILESFSDESHPAYGQVATVDERNFPHVRTVHLRYVSERKTIVFGTNTQSAKWLHLSMKPFLSACYFDQGRQVQFRFDADATRVDPERAGKEDEALLDQMWSMTRSTVREVYWQDVQHVPFTQRLPDTFDTDKRCPTFGAIVCTPNSWDIYELLSEDYHDHRRTIHKLENGVWRSKSVVTLHGNPIEI